MPSETRNTIRDRCSENTDVISDSNLCVLEEDAIEKLEFDATELSENCREMLAKVEKEFSSLFSTSKYDIGLANEFTHIIELKDGNPVNEPIRRAPLALQNKVDEFIEEMLKRKVIQPSTSEWNAPVVVVPKKNGDLRLTIDYRKLNMKTKVPVFPIPNMQQMFDALNGAKIFSTID